MTKNFIQFIKGKIRDKKNTKTFTQAKQIIIRKFGQPKDCKKLDTVTKLHKI